MDVYTGNVYKCLVFAPNLCLLYCIFLNVLEVFFFITLYIECLDQCPTDNVINQILIP